MENNRFDYILNYSQNIDPKVKLVLEDIVKNHNNSWVKEIYERNKNDMDSVALLYRGTKITYKEMFDNAFKYAKSLAQLGVGEKYKELPVCMANCPEFVYILLAANMLGIKLNIFNDTFDKEYIKEIINNSGSKIFVGTDNMYENLKDVIRETNIETPVLFSLTDSLKHGIDPYIELDREFYDFKNKVDLYKNKNSKLINKEEFLNIGKNYDKEIKMEGNLDDEFLITYTSGSTNTTRPKAIIHRNSSLITIARFHDKDASNLPTIENVNVLAQIPTHSNTDIITSISDTLSKNCTVALEPIYNEKFFLNSLLINKSNIVYATRSFWLTAFKKINNDEAYKDIKMPYLILPTEVGEPLAPNEEKFLNKILRKVKAGSYRVKLPISPICMSIGGGDCEHGGLFFTIFKSLKQKMPKYSLDKNGLGLEPFKMVDCKILDENGNEVKSGKLGNLVANSPCTMVKYKDNEDATKNFFVKDSDGNNWADCKVFAFKDKNNTIHMKGRMDNCYKLSNGTNIPLFQIADVVLKDTKNILSCEPIMVDGSIVIHVECMPNIKSATKIVKTIESAQNRCLKSFPEELTRNIFYKVRNSNVPFPTTGCGKRNNLKLASEGFIGTFKIDEMLNKQEHNSNSYQKIKK